MIRGFLPDQDPIETILTQRPQYAALEATLENLAVTLPDLVEQRRVREELVCQLRQVAGSYDEAWASTTDKARYGDGDPWGERVMLLYSYFASAYVYSRHENPADRIPKEIAVPLVRFSQRTARPPILSYASYCLNNWRRLDPNKPVELGNIELLQNFCAPAVGKQDEDWFILVHVDIEQKAADGLAAINNASLFGMKEELAVYNTFVRIIDSLRSMNQTLNRMPEECSPDNYYKWVRPYIFGFKGVVYESCFDDQPQTFRGETGAQSSIIPAMILALGIEHKDSMLTKHLEEMRDYMPPQHRAFLRNLEARLTKNTLRDAVARFPGCKAAYNEAVQQVADFRAKHFEYAMNYIAKKVQNPEGTGGTPYLPWLQQLKDETLAHLLPS